MPDSSPPASPPASARLLIETDASGGQAVAVEDLSEWLERSTATTERMENAAIALRAEVRLAEALLGQNSDSMAGAVGSPELCAPTVSVEEHALAGLREQCRLRRRQLDALQHKVEASTGQCKEMRKRLQQLRADGDVVCKRAEALAQRSCHPPASATVSPLLERIQELAGQAEWAKKLEGAGGAPRLQRGPHDMPSPSPRGAALGRSQSAEARLGRSLPPLPRRVRFDDRLQESPRRPREPAAPGMAARSRSPILKRRLPGAAVMRDSSEGAASHDPAPATAASGATGAQASSATVVGGTSAVAVTSAPASTPPAVEIPVVNLAPAAKLVVQSAPSFLVPAITALRGEVDSATSTPTAEPARQHAQCSATPLVAHRHMHALMPAPLLLSPPVARRVVSPPPGARLTAVPSAVLGHECALTSVRAQLTAAAAAGSRHYLEGVFSGGAGMSVSTVVRRSCSQVSVVPIPGQTH
mmetsp:Transcript_133287/g.371561  ORF Transcript_133287/g.371561 Transcript_133287/m.371561 type:complete len:472 (-) Transcript_133287:71-1486(-)